MNIDCQDVKVKNIWSMPAFGFCIIIVLMCISGRQQKHLWKDFNVFQTLIYEEKFIWRKMLNLIIFFLWSNTSVKASFWSFISFHFHIKCLSLALMIFIYLLFSASWKKYMGIDGGLHYFILRLFRYLFFKIFK